MTDATNEMATILHALLITLSLGMLISFLVTCQEEEEEPKAQRTTADIRIREDHHDLESMPVSSPNTGNSCASLVGRRTYNRVASYTI